LGQPGRKALGKERGVEVDHATLNRWLLKYVPLLEQKLWVRKRPVDLGWRMDETYVKVKGSPIQFYSLVG
jgi:putative transposase